MDRLLAFTNSICIVYILLLSSCDSPNYYTVQTPRGSRTMEYIDSVHKINESQMIPSYINSDKYVIYTCTGKLRRANCGGWSDRMKTIITSYILSLLTERQFGIYDTFPCDFAESFDENLVKWKVDEEKLGKLSSQQYFSTSSNLKRTRNHFRSADFDKIYDKDVVYFHGNWDFLNEYAERQEVGKRLPWLTKLPRPDIYRSILKILLKPSPLVQKRIDDFFETNVKERKLICAHIRQGRSKTLPSDDPSGLTEGDLDNIFTFLDGYKSPNNKIFIATDSEEILNSARKRFSGYLAEVSGPITHMDISRNGELCEGQRRSFIEHNILSKCDTLLLSRSGFGIIAAFMRQDSDDLYCLHRRYISPCSRYLLTKLYPWTMSPWDDL